jgi:general L-amino acid transport system permease protein
MTFLNPANEAIPPSIDSGDFVAGMPMAPAPAPSSIVGPRAWVKEHLFGGMFNTVMTLALLLLLAWLVPPLIRFLFIDAVWSGADREACIITPERPVVGACWAFVRDRAAFFTYGSYPIPERWRVNLFFALLAIGIVWLLSLKAPRRVRGRLFLRRAAACCPICCWWARPGWAFPSSRPIYGAVLRVHRGVGGRHRRVAALAACVLALGRRSTMPAARFVSIIFIEFGAAACPSSPCCSWPASCCRSSCPSNGSADKLLRALIGIALFASAYMAEVVRWIAGAA